MTKKHFIAFAKSICQLPDEGQRRIMAKIVCDVAMADNPRFDVARFLEACDVNVS